jgi:hypothetical protein
MPDLNPRAVARSGPATLATDIAAMTEQTRDMMRAYAETLRRRAEAAGRDQAVADMISFLMTLPAAESVSVAIVALIDMTWPEPAEPG